MLKNIKSLLNPKAVAIIGASRDPDKVGNVILSKLLAGGFPGEVYPVNPNANKVKGLTCYDSVLDIEQKIDLAAISIPSALVKDALEDCGQKGVKNVVIISAGFAEAGDAGKKAEQELQVVAKKYDLNLLGPNCLGFISTFSKVNLTFSDADPLKGSLALISQSGAIGTAFLDWARENNVGLAHFVSLGNKAGLDENDFLEEMGKDQRVHAILMYLEEFKDGAKFFKLASRISQVKPIVVLKPGRFSETQHAMQSHTGALAQDEKIIATALRDAGCIQVYTIEELFNVTKVLSWQPVLTGNRVVIITNAGGIGIQAVDDLAGNGLLVPPLPDLIKKEIKFKHLFANQINISNPIDLLGDASAEKYQIALETIIKNNQIDCILVILSPQKVTEALLTAELVNSIADRHKKVVVASFVGGEKLKTAVKFFHVNKIPHFTFPNDAARTLGLIWNWRKKLSTGKQAFYEPGPTVINQELSAHTAANGVVELLFAQGLFSKFKLKLIPSEVVSNFKELREKLKIIKYPLVLKLVHPKLIHKTEFKAVRLNIENEYELTKEFNELNKIVKAQNLAAAKYEIQPYLQDKIELFIGVKKDRSFGHFLLLGSGGIYTEVYQDIALKILPITTKQEALNLLLTAKVGSILTGARGKNYNIEAVVKIILNLSKMIEKNNNILEIDINPLFVTKKDVFVADLKIFA